MIDQLIKCLPLGVGQVVPEESTEAWFEGVFPESVLAYLEAFRF